MEHGYKTVKLTSIFLYIMAGLFGIFSGIAENKFPSAGIVYLFVFIWLSVTTLLCLTGVETEKQGYRFAIVSVFFMSGLGFFDAYLLGLPYVFVVYQFWFIVSNIAALRKDIMRALAIIGILGTIVLTIGLGMLSVLEMTFISSAFIFAYWAAVTYINRTTKMLHIIEIQNQSRDDMIALMESRFMEEKGANNAKSTFLANMSHEIRTPINAILGMNTMILRESKEEATLENAREIENSSHTLLALINDILDISKVESGKMEVIPVEYELSKLLKDVMNMVSFKAEAKKLEMKLDVARELPRKLFGDDVRIRQILINLMNNAVKYTEKGSVTLKVTGEVAESVVILKFVVQDTGIGIREEDMEKLFSKFERLDVVKNRNVEGTGLGMAITQKFLGLMNTKLEVKSTYGQGSVFSFYLMQNIIDKTPVGEVEIKGNNEISDRSTSKEIRFVAPDAKILIVDDNAINRKVFIKLLKRIKTQIWEADSGFKALEMLNSMEFDLIFLDHMMPEMDGIETLHRFRENKQTSNHEKPVIALTANALTGSKEYYLEQGFDDYLSKPIIPEKLEKMIMNRLPDNMIEIFS